MITFRDFLLVVVFAVLLAGSPGLLVAETISIEDDPPTQQCLDQGDGLYGTVGGYCLDGNKDGISYLSVSKHVVEVGEVFELTLYTDIGRGYPLGSTFLYEPVHWNCAFFDAGACTDRPMTTLGPSLRLADTEVAGSDSEVSSSAVLDFLPCEDTNGTCQQGWKVSGDDGKGNTTFFTRKAWIKSISDEDTNTWLVVASGTEAEDYVAVYVDKSENPCQALGAEDGCEVKLIAKFAAGKKSKLSCAVKINGKRSANVSVSIQQAAAKDGEFGAVGAAKTTNKKGIAKFPTRPATRGYFLRCKAGDFVSAPKKLSKGRKKKRR